MGGMQSVQCRHLLTVVVKPALIKSQWRQPLETPIKGRRGPMALHPPCPTRSPYLLCRLRNSFMFSPVLLFFRLLDFLMHRELSILLIRLI